MQECCFHSLLLSGTVSLFILSLFFPLSSPERGSPLMPREGSGYRTPSPRLGPSARLTCLHSSALIWRSQGPPPLCGVQTLSPPLHRKKAGPTHWNAGVLTLTGVCWLEAMSIPVRFGRASARTTFLAYLAAALKVKDFFSASRQISCRDCGGRNETRLTGQGGLFSLKKGGGISLACTLPEGMLREGFVREENSLWD